MPCKPTKVNGGRLWNRPQHAPDKWATFKEYNKRDVEVEMSIQKVLAKFPVPDSVWEEYHLSEQINDRGIGLDRQMVEQAIRQRHRPGSADGRAGHTVGCPVP